DAFAPGVAGVAAGVGDRVLGPRRLRARLRVLRGAGDRLRRPHRRQASVRAPRGGARRRCRGQRGAAGAQPGALHRRHLRRAADGARPAGAAVGRPARRHTGRAPAAVARGAGGRPPALRLGRGGDAARRVLPASRARARARGAAGAGPPARTPRRRARTRFPSRRARPRPAAAALERLPPGARLAAFDGMDYARFVALRRPLWDSFERDATAARRRDFSYAEVEELALRYRQVLHDHAWARARFPGTGAAQRLHRLAVLGGTVLQREDEERFSIVRFFFERFPAAVRASVPWIGVAVALFLVSGLLGWAVAVYEPGVAVATLGPDRVEDLRRGHLWTESLTTTVPPSISSSFIATNNMSVALTAWAGGALAGLGSLWVAIFNGFLLGAIFGVTARFSMAGELGEFVVAHGLLELTLILVCAGAGLGIGAALLRAGDL